jgi:hypothetical protein
VKIIEHSERSPGTASSGGKRINIGRESLLATQMSHPNIVSSTSSPGSKASQTVCLQELDALCSSGLKLLTEAVVRR